MNAKDRGLTVKQGLFTGDVSIVDSPWKHSDDTALCIAVQSPKYKCVDLLIKSGADVNMCNSSGESALILAVKSGHTKYIKPLIAAGADVNMYNANSETALILAVKSENLECIEQLLEAGADVNTRAATLLWISASRYDLKALQTLLRAGITINNVTHSTLNQYLRCRRGQAKKEVVLILAAAGEKIDERKVPTPRYLLPRRLSLMHLCRETIRNYLLLLDKRKNLFLRVPDLELPPVMTQYLLYNVSFHDLDLSAVESI